MKFILFSAFCVVMAAAMPYDIVEDEDGQQFYAVPVSREKRQTQWGVNQAGAGISHTGNLFDNNNHRVDGTASAAKNWGSHGLRPDQVGGRLDYNHKPSGSSAFVGADNMRGYGTDVNAGVKYNIHQSKNLGVDLSGQYGRHYGGPGGTRDLGSSVFLNANGRF
uniref:Attacin C1 n=1 Tax=Octodonta nipae TaxID=1432747 RepID=A0A5S9BF65_9CUCU|nr:attacin C1 [Octodonta nipae]